MSVAKTGLLALLGGLLVAPPAFAQNPDSMDPDQNAAKARQLLKQAVAAMGGSAFQNGVESDCEGRVAQFDRNGGTLGYNNIRSYWRYPDKSRTEYVVKSTKGGIFAVLVGNLPVKGGVFIQLFNGDQGWTMDKSGVNEADATVVAEFQSAAKRQLHNLLMNQVKQEGVFLRYGGGGIVDLHPVEWVEISEQDGRTVRLALEHLSHLPLRTVVTTPNEETRDTDEDVTIYSNYENKQGVQTPLQISREHNGRRTYQLFYNSCNNNPNLPMDFFTAESLRERFKKTGGKVKEEK
jgi:hypothetical protein